VSEVETLQDAIRHELLCLWDDLHRARTNAYSGKWSMLCDNLELRIKGLTPLVGPTPWDEIQIPLLEDGIYQRIHADLGVEVAPDMARVAQVCARIDESAARSR
jgi:hypothetical protein